MYQIDGRDVLYAWLEHETDSERRLCMLEWLVGLAEYPMRDAQRVPDVRAPVFMSFVPLDPPVAVTYLIADQFHTVKLLRVRTMG